MDVNERIARALGWQWHEGTTYETAVVIGDPHWCSPEGQCLSIPPDYAHSLDACLPVLADLRTKGWWWSVGGSDEGFTAMLATETWETYREADTPAAALAKCLADALETEKSPD